MTKTTSFLIVPVLALAALLTAVVLPGMASHAPDVNISFPAAQAAIPVDEIEFDGFVLSTKHQNSGKVIQGLIGMQGVRTNTSAFEFKPGSIQIWGGLHPRRTGWATISIVWANENSVWFAALEAPLSSGGMIPSAIRVGPEAFVNSADLKWAAAWILSKNAKGPGRLADDPAQYLSLGEGWVRWLELKQAWGLNYLIEVIPFLPPPPGGN